MKLENYINNTPSKLHEAIQWIVKLENLEKIANHYNIDLQRNTVNESVRKLLTEAQFDFPDYMGLPEHIVKMC